MLFSISVQSEAAMALSTITSVHCDNPKTQAIIWEGALSQFMLVLDVSQDMELCQIIICVLGINIV